MQTELSAAQPSSYSALAPAVFVTGKGGVGKTTVAAGLATAAAQSGEGAVFVEFGDGESGKRALGKKNRRIAHVVIRPQDAVLRAAGPLFGSVTVAKLVLGNFAMRPLIQSAPAIRELAVLELTRQVVAKYPGRRVVIDMPATGHSIAWLRVAQQGRDLTGSGPLYELCDRVQRELLRPGRASIVVVTLPQRLVLAETSNLCHSLETEVGLEVDRLVVNRVPAMPPNNALGDARNLKRKEGPVGVAAGQMAELLAVRHEVGSHVLEALRESIHRGRSGLTLLPLHPADPSAVTVADWLTQRGAG